MWDYVRIRENHPPQLSLQRKYSKIDNRAKDIIAQVIQLFSYCCRRLYRVKMSPPIKSIRITCQRTNLKQYIKNI